MPTHPIGSGTANLSINVPIDERTLWGRLGFLAVERGEAKSVSDFERKVLAKGLEAIDPAAAARLREIRSRYYAGTLAALLLASVAFPWFGSAADDTAARRSSSTVGVRLTVRRGRQELEEIFA
jgi:hypothetical protein